MKAAVTSDQVRQAELDLILNRSPADRRDDPDLWGIALSGGGIRSATFALGVLQVLARNHLLGAFHYLSTVSGGGYTGAFVQGLIRRRGYAETYNVLKSSIQEAAKPTAAAPSDPAVDAQRPILHLRQYSNYLSPRKSTFSGDSLGMIGTYVRNVVLVQTQLLALLLASSLVPLLLYPLMQRGAARWPIDLLLVAGAAGAVAALLLGLVLGLAGRPRRAKPAAADAVGSALQNDSKTDARQSAATDASAARVIRSAFAAIGLTLIAVYCASAGFWGLNGELAGRVAGLSPDVAKPFENALDLGVFAWTAAIYLACWIAWLAWSLLDMRPPMSNADDEAPSPLRRYRMRFLMSSLGASAFAGLSLVAVRHVFLSWQGVTGLWQALILGPSCVLAAVTLTGVFHIGFAGPALTDLQREVWARIGGRIFAFVSIGVGLLSALCVYGPLLIRYGLWFADTRWVATGWLGVAGWIVTTVAGVLSAYNQRVTGDAKTKSRLLDVLARVAPTVFLIGLAVLVSFAGQEILAAAGWGHFPSLNNVDADGVAGTYFGNLAKGPLTHYATLAIVAIAALLVWFVFGYAVDLNEFSMNSFYRNRIVRCYLGASNPGRTPEATTDFDPNDDLVLADLVQRERTQTADMRPLFPLVNATLNLVATKQLDWQDRKAASFCFSPGYCGYIPPPSHPGACAVGDAAAAVAGTARMHERSGGPVDRNPIAASLTLGDAIAISGAAVSPNMGYHSSPAVTMLLTLFDARLGWWLPNPTIAATDADSVPRFSGWWLLREMFGLTNETSRLLYLSDGGHFENLGIYELVRRRCRFIICVDSSADPERMFGDLGDAIQKCRVDFGVEIEIDTSALRLGPAGTSAHSCAVGSVHYPGGDAGTLLYLKPSLTGAEPADVATYASAHPCFPHEPTSDQYFEEAQFESYRRLGETVATSALEATLERASALPSTATAGHLGLVDTALKQKILVELEHRWIAPAALDRGRFSLHAKAMSDLFATLRSTPELKILDAQIYPAWTDLVPSDAAAADEAPATPLERRTDLPTDAQFRTCFYFCQELIQLMESVYQDLQLEQSWQHPDNRGWINIFRHWSASPIFRIAWSVGSPTFGRAFVTFCELRLDLPQLHDVVVARETHPDGTAWVPHCEQLAASGGLNHVELGIVKSDALRAHADQGRFRLVLLRMKWRPVLRQSGGLLDETTVGIAVLEGATLRVLRVQDHLRRMGLGAEFMRRLIATCEVRDIDIREGHYGISGVLTAREARDVEQKIRALHTRQMRIRRSSNPPPNEIKK